MQDKPTGELMKKSIICAAAFGGLLAFVFAAAGFYKKIPQAEITEKVSGLEEWEKPDLEYLEYYGVGAFDTTLPVLFIDTKEQRITKDMPIEASVAVLENETGMKRSVLDTPNREYVMTIKHRGASSYSQFDKKQYRIKFYEEEGSEKDMGVPFLGMGKHSEWVLNGPFLDKTLMRNRMVYEVGKMLFEWAPDSRYVEVFVDGKYQGVYLAVEPVTNGESRLRLSKFGLLSGETSYLVKRDRIGTEQNPLFVYGKTEGKTNSDLFVSYPVSSRLTKAQKKWITADISAFEKALYGEDFADPHTGYGNYIDIDNFVDYFIFNEAVMNYDAGNLSTYAYKELGGKLQLAIWDYNNCYDNYQEGSQNYEEIFMLDNSWFSRLLQDRGFVERVVERYFQLRKSILAEENFYELLEKNEKLLGDAIERNFAVWGYTFDVNLLSGDGERDLKSYEQAVRQLTEAIHKRLTALDEQMPKLYQNCIN